jgi:sulfate transport system ATP-binding protein
VYRFLGDVNVFHGRLSQGEADSSGEHDVTFVRPHDLELSRDPTTTTQLAATVRFVTAAGSRVRIELMSKNSSQTIEVELTKERYRELKLRQGDVVFVYPKQLQVFRLPDSWSA